MSNEENIKKIIIINESETPKLKKVNCEKEKKMRVETKTWGLSEEELSHNNQLNNLLLICNNKDKNITNNSYNARIISHIKAKINSYKQQDIVKKKLNTNDFVTFEKVIELLLDSELKCHFCADEVFILYEKVRENKQWSLDRINNDIGHNINNLVIACLECNLKRRRTNKDAFMFTKNMKINKVF